MENKQKKKTREKKREKLYFILKNSQDQFEKQIFIELLQKTIKKCYH